MSAWIRTIVLGAIVGVAAPASAEPVEQSDPIELALRTEDYPHAENLARTQLAESERRHGNTSLQTLQAIDALVDALLDGERLETPDLETLIGREVELARKLAGADSREHARALMRKARWYQLRGDFLPFSTTIESAFEISQRVATKNDPERAEIEVLAGTSRVQYQSNPAGGAPVLARGLEVLTAAKPRRPRALSMAQLAYGRVKRTTYQTADAVRILSDAEAYARTTFGPRSARRSEALTFLGYALRESGQYGSGIDALEEGAKIAAATKPYRQRLHVDALIALAGNQAMIGELRPAREAFEQARSIEQARLTGNGYLLAADLKGLALLQGSQGDFNGAAATLERALPMHERIYGADSKQAKNVLVAYASALLRSGNLDKSSAIYERLVADYEANPKLFPARMPKPHAALGIVRLWQKRYAEAETLHRRFLAGFGEGRDFDEINGRQEIAGLAAALWGQGRHQEAFAEVVRAQQSALRVQRRALSQLSERQLLLLDRELDILGMAVAIANDSRDPKPIGQAWALLAEASGGVTQAMATRLALASTEHQNAALWQDWRTANDALSAARVTATKAASAQAIEVVDDQQRAVDKIERRIANLDTHEGRTLHAEQGDIASILANLPTDAALVRFVEVANSAPDRYTRDLSGASNRLFALVGTRDEAARIVDLGMVGDTARAADAWYSSVSARANEAAQVSPAARSLRRTLIDPLAIGGHVKRVFVVPSPAINRINFAALVDEQGRYLVESGPAFHLLNHERELLLPQTETTPNSVLLAGAITKSHTTTTVANFGPVMRKACPGIGAGQLGLLPGAASEIASLREVAQGRAGQIDVLSGAAATEAAVRDAMPGHSIVHLATHAFAFGDHCVDGDALRSIALDLPQADGKPADVENLSSLSALAFLPQPDDKNTYDGLLTSEEITTLNLSAADWVVLSACETALGRTTGNEGVFGLRRAFRLAGARTIVMSLWKVEDQATAEFMRELYKMRLVDRLDTPAAMQAAMRTTLDARRTRGESTHPLYWAGFVAAGAWR